MGAWRRREVRRAGAAEEAAAVVAAATHAFARPRPATAPLPPAAAELLAGLDDDGPRTAVAASPSSSPHRGSAAVVAAEERAVAARAVRDEGVPPALYSYELRSFMASSFAAAGALGEAADEYARAATYAAQRETAPRRARGGDPPQRWRQRVVAAEPVEQKDNALAEKVRHGVRLHNRV